VHLLSVKCCFAFWTGVLQATLGTQGCLCSYRLRHAQCSTKRTRLLVSNTKGSYVFAFPACLSVCQLCFLSEEQSPAAGAATCSATSSAEERPQYLDMVVATSPALQLWPPAVADQR
jgi:hypothetical protein